MQQLTYGVLVQHFTILPQAEFLSYHTREETTKDWCKWTMNSYSMVQVFEKSFFVWKTKISLKQALKVKVTSFGSYSAVQPPFDI